MRGNIRIQIDRPLLDQKEYDRLTQYKPVDFSLREYSRRMCLKCKWTEVTKIIIPMVDWLPKYNWKNDILADLTIGLSIGLLNIPQSLAYAMLANAPPAMGLYMAVFPSIIYAIFSTSRHNSIGTFSVTCLMTGYLLADVIEQLKNSESGKDASVQTYTSMEIVCTAAFLVAIMQFIMYFMRLGFIANILSEPLILGFIGAAGIQVFVSMLPVLFGIPTKPVRTEMYTIPVIIYNFVLRLSEANTVAITLSVLSLGFILLGNGTIKLWLEKFTFFQLPTEVIVLIIGTILGYFGNLHYNYNVEVIEPVPAGLPTPRLPKFALIPKIAFQCFLISLVSYSITISIALIVANTGRYRIRKNQEIFAMGISNLVGSFFSCMPICASLSRTTIQFQNGGKSQLASLISAIFNLVVLFFVGPLLVTLPKCVLASVVVVATRGMVQRARDLARFFRTSYWDAAVWTAAFVPTIIFSDTIGLLCGMVLSLISLVVRAHNPYSCVMGNLPGTEMYLDQELHAGAEPIEGVTIFHYCGTLSYAVNLHFRRLVYHATKTSPLDTNQYNINPFTAEIADVSYRSESLQCLIIDFSALRYIDVDSVEVLDLLIKEYQAVNVATYLAGCSRIIFESFALSQKVLSKKYNFITFPTVHDAVLYAKANVLKQEI